jgi:hypothetical protein
MLGKLFSHGHEGQQICTIHLKNTPFVVTTDEPIQPLVCNEGEEIIAVTGYD